MEYSTREGRSNVTHGNWVFRVVNKRCQALQLRSPSPHSELRKVTNLRRGRVERGGETMNVKEQNVLCVC